MDSDKRKRISELLCSAEEDLNKFKLLLDKTFPKAAEEKQELDNFRRAAHKINS